MDDIRLQVSIPTDDDGFVRQRCDMCGREFKSPVEDGDMVTAACCPYCGVAGDNWFTPEQMEYFQQELLAAAMPELAGDFKKMASDFNRETGGFVTMEVDAPEVDVPLLKPEAPDMTLVASPCCDAKVKLHDDWSGDTYCTACCSTFAA